MESSGRNRTPDKLPRSERSALFEVCDRHLRDSIQILQPDWVIGVGDFAADRAREAIQDESVRIGKILHPSPACPASNVDWSGKATAQLQKLGVW
jgi:single-strand selective monofunctional uracil DNA glycosylase